MKQFIDELVNENIQLKQDLATYPHAVKRKNKTHSSPQTKKDSANLASVLEDSIPSPTRNEDNTFFLGDALELSPLESPPDVVTLSDALYEEESD